MSKRYYKHIIPLGVGCQIATHLRKNNLRKEAYPLDWCETAFQALYFLIERDFAHFFDEESISINNAQTYIDQNKLHAKIPNQSYGYDIGFNHEFTPEDIKDYSKFQEKFLQNKEKYSRRIARFYSAVASGGPVLFIRYNINKSESIRLNELLLKKFPKLDYDLLVIHSTDEIKEDWRIPRIINRYIKTTQVDPTDSPEFYNAWANIFNSIIENNEPKN